MSAGNALFKYDNTPSYSLHLHIQGGSVKAEFQNLKYGHAKTSNVGSVNPAMINLGNFRRSLPSTV